MTQVPDTAADTAFQAETNADVARATGVLALGNILSRVLGLLREIVLSNLFGASRALESFNNALVISKSLYDLLLAGHVNSAIVPVLSEVEQRHGREAFMRLVSLLMSLVTLIVSGLGLLILLFAPQIVGLVSGGDPETQALSALLLRLTTPGLVFLSLFAVLSGALYALRRFAYPALSQAVFNGVLVLLILLLVPPLAFVPTLTGGGVTWALERPTAGIIAAAAAWMAAALTQLALQVIGLRRAMRGSPLRFTLYWRHPALRQIALLYAPVMGSLLIDTLVIRIFSYNLAAQGPISHGNNYMIWATTLIQFPQGLVATAISLAILPTLSRQAAAQSLTAFKDTLGLGLRLAAALILPAAVGLFVLALPIIALILEHGAFTPTDTAITALALRLYLLGLPFAALDLLLVYAFYARQDTLTPALVGVLSLLVYMAVAVGLHPHMGLFSLMAADSVKHVTHALVSGWLLHRRLGGLGGQRLLSTLLHTGVASALMGGVLALLAAPLGTAFSGAGLLGEILIVSLAGGAGLLVFLMAAFTLKIEELRWIAGLIRQKLLAKQG